MTAPGSRPYAVVVGGANLDLVARCHESVVHGTSNPGTLSRRPGGVARNVAENLARLGSRVELVAAVGADAEGEELLGSCRQAGVGVEHLVRTEGSTGTYTAVLDADGELVAAVADMAATEAVDSAVLSALDDLLRGASFVAADGNLGPETLAALLDLVARRVPVVLDPASVPKAARLASVLRPRRPVHTITPTQAELRALTGGREGREAAQRLHERGVTHVWVRRGAEGSTLFVAPDRMLDLKAPVVDVVDVTGAGDAGLAAYVHALLRGLEPVAAAAYGQAASAVTVGVSGAVMPDLAAVIGPPRVMLAGHEGTG